MFGTFSSHLNMSGVIIAQHQTVYFCGKNVRLSRMVGKFMVDEYIKPRCNLAIKILSVIGLRNFQKCCFLIKIYGKRYFKLPHSGVSIAFLCRCKVR